MNPSPEKSSRTPELTDDELETLVRHVLRTEFVRRCVENAAAVTGPGRIPSFWQRRPVWQRRGVWVVTCGVIITIIVGTAVWSLQPGSKDPGPTPGPGPERRDPGPGPTLPDSQSPPEQPNRVAKREWSILGPATSLSSADAKGWREDITAETGKSDVAVLDVTAGAIRPMKVTNLQRDGTRLSFSAECETDIDNRLTILLFFHKTGWEPPRIASLGSILTREDFRELLDAAKNADVPRIRDIIHGALTANSPDGRWAGSPSDILPLLKEMK